MSKIKKSDLLRLIKEQAIAINHLSGMVEMNKFSIIKLENEREQPKPKKLDQSVFDGQTDEKKFFAIDEDGQGWFYRNKPSIIEDDKRWMEPNYTPTRAGFDYGSLNWRDSLIERESKELTGSDLCRAMLDRGDKYVMCLVSDKCQESVRHNDIIRVIYSHGVDYFEDKTYDMWNFVVPINNQGEPLTAAEVGLL